MRYYKLSESTLETEIGTYPQVNSLDISYGKAYAERFQQLPAWNNEHDIPLLDCFKLDHSAFLTDLISSNFAISLNAMLVSDRAFNEINRLKIFDLNHRNAIIINGDNVKHPYEFIWYNSAHEIINFKKSTFFEYDSMSKIYHNKHNLSSFNEFNEKYDSIFDNNFLELYPKKLFLKEQYDIFFPGCTSNLICSERFFNTIQKNNLTGFQFKDLDYEVVVE